MGQYADTRTLEQKIAMLLPEMRLCMVFRISPDGIHGHREFAAKACPCYNVAADNDSWQQIVAEVLERNIYDFGKWRKS